MFFALYDVIQRDNKKIYHYMILNKINKNVNKTDSESTKTLYVDPRVTEAELGGRRSKGGGYIVYKCGAVDG